MERLPLLASVTEAAQRYREHFFSLLQVIALPALAYAVVSYFWGGIDTTDPLRIFLPMVVQGLLLTLAALSCHRVILLGSESVPALGTSGTSARDWRFIGMAMLLFVITNLLLQVPVTALFLSLSVAKPDWITLGPEVVTNIGRVAALPALYVACRFSLCLPAIAVDQRLRMKQAWVLTRGYGWRLLLLIGVAPWLLHFLQRSLAGAFSSATDYFVAGQLLFWLLMPLEIALLSICYRRLGKPV